MDNPHRKRSLPRPAGRPRIPASIPAAPPNVESIAAEVLAGFIEIVTFRTPQSRTAVTGAGGVVTVICWIVIYIASAALGRLIAGVLHTSEPFIELILAILIYGLPAAFLLWRLPILAQASLRDIGLRAPAARDWQAFAQVIVVVALVNILLATAALLVQQIYSNPAFAHPHMYTPPPHLSVTFALIVTIIVAGVLGPFSSELLSRGVVFRGMRVHTGFGTAALVASLFGTAWNPLWLFPVYIGLDFLISWSYERTGNLYISMLVRSFNNFALIAGVAITGYLMRG